MGNIVATVSWLPNSSDELFKHHLNGLAKTYGMTETHPNNLLYCPNKTSYGNSIEGLRLILWNRTDANKHVRNYAQDAKNLLKQQGAEEVAMSVDDRPL